MFQRVRTAQFQIIQLEHIEVFFLFFWHLKNLVFLPLINLKIYIEIEQYSTRRTAMSLVKYFQVETSNWAIGKIASICVLFIPNKNLLKNFFFFLKNKDEKFASFL